MSSKSEMVMSYDTGHGMAPIINAACQVATTIYNSLSSTTNEVYDDAMEEVSTSIEYASAELKRSDLTDNERDELHKTRKEDRDYRKELMAQKGMENRKNMVFAFAGVAGLASIAFVTELVYRR